MSGVNVEALRAVYSGLAVGDGEMFWALLDDDVVWDERDQDWPEANVYVGVSGVRKLLKAWLSQWDDFRWIARDFMPVGASVVVTVLQRARGKVSGIDVEQERSQVWTFRDGRVVAFKSFLTRADAADYAAALDGRAAADG